MAGTAKGGVTGGSGREGGAPAGARVCPAGARAAAEGKGVSCEPAPRGVPGTRSERREAASCQSEGRRGGSGENSEETGVISQRSSQLSRRLTRHWASRRRGGRTPPETPGKGPRGREQPPETAPG